MSIKTTGLVASCEAISQLEVATNTPSHNPSLPPGFKPFAEFSKDFTLGHVSTEKVNPITANLSRLMHASVPKGMELLLQVDEMIIKGLEEFIPTIQRLAPELAKRLEKGGRMFLTGAGSSGRIAIDLAAKCTATFPEYKAVVRGIIAGGDTAIIRSKEDFEDSEEDGAKIIDGCGLTQGDTVILLSASGSSSYNAGCGNQAANSGAMVYYFYNSNNIPARTSSLFQRSNNPVIPLCVDIGPQAISGSTRLQAATLAEACLGSLLGSTFLYCRKNETLALQFPRDLVTKLIRGFVLLRDQLQMISKFTEIEAKIFSNPSSNFRKVKDETDVGYVTFLSKKSGALETLMDVTECSPTFSVNPLRKEQEVHKKRPEFSFYLHEEGDNGKAWTSILGRAIEPKDAPEGASYSLSMHAEGANSYKNRPTRAGNFVVGVIKLEEGEELPCDLIKTLSIAKLGGGAIGIIAMNSGSFNENDEATVKRLSDASLIADRVPSDIMGISGTIFLKQTMNLISNGSMTLMNKVHGNRLIDSAVSNQKLIDRSMRLITDIWNGVQNPPLESMKLYHLIAEIVAKKKEEEERGNYVPSVAKIALTMLQAKMEIEDFPHAVNKLRKNDECIDITDFLQPYLNL